MFCVWLFSRIRVTEKYTSSVWHFTDSEKDLKQIKWQGYYRCGIKFEKQVVIDFS